MARIQRGAEDGKERLYHRLRRDDAAEPPKPVEENYGRNKENRVAQNRDGEGIKRLSQGLKIAGYHVDYGEHGRREAEDFEEIAGLADQRLFMQENCGELPPRKQEQCGKSSTQKDAVSDMRRA